MTHLATPPPALFTVSGRGRARRVRESIDVKTVRSVLGHANAIMTLNIYASADADAKRAAAMTIDEVMGRRLAPQEMGSFA
ncbi:MAG: hypothetical protein J6D54_00905 [Olsenella sp.]|nr:hypothetical protein [Olsenella sp.]